MRSIFGAFLFALLPSVVLAQGQCPEQNVFPFQENCKLTAANLNAVIISRMSRNADNVSDPETTRINLGAMSRNADNVSDPAQTRANLGSLALDASNATLPTARSNLIYTPAVCDAFTANDATTSTVGSVTTLTSPSANFTGGIAAAYVGEPITVAAAGATWGLASAAVAAAGTNYLPGELLPLALGNGAGTPGQLRVVTVKAVSVVSTPVTGGSGASADGAGIALTTLDGPAGVDVGTRPTFTGTITAGALTSVSLTTAGSLKSNIPDPSNVRVTTADGTLMGATIDVTMGVDTVVPQDNMGQYSIQTTGSATHATQPVWSPGREGSGATFTLTYYRENHVTTIASIVDATHVTLATQVAADVSAQKFAHGTDQQLLWNAQIQAGVPVHLPPGSTCAASSLELVSGATFRGIGIGTSNQSTSKIVYIGPPGVETKQITTPADATIAGVTVGDFELDGAGAAAIGMDESGMQGSHVLPLAILRHTTYGYYGRGRRGSVTNQPAQFLTHGMFQISQNSPTNLTSIKSAMGLSVSRSDPTGTNYNLSSFSVIRATTTNGVPMQIGGTDTTIFGGLLVLRGPTTVPGLELLGANFKYFPALASRLAGILDAGNGGLYIRSLGFGSPSKQFDISYYQTLNGAPPPIVEKNGGKWNSGATAYIQNSVADAEISGTPSGKSGGRLSPRSVTRDEYVTYSDSGTYYNTAGALAGDTVNFYLPLGAASGNHYCFQTLVGTRMNIWSAFNANLALGGTVTVGDVVSLTFTSASKGWTGGARPVVSYTAVTDDTLGLIGWNLQDGVMKNSTLRSAHVTSYNGATRPAANGTSLPTFNWWNISDLAITASVSGAATETAVIAQVNDKITLGNNMGTALGGYIYTDNAPGESICVLDARALGTGDSNVGNGTWFASSPGNINNWNVDGVGLGWTAYTPTLSCGSGTLTSATATGRYKINGKTVNLSAEVAITTNGSCAGVLNVSLPAGSVVIPLSLGVNILPGYESATGLMLQGRVGSATVVVTKYEGSYPGATGATVSVNGSYEMQ